MSVLVIHLPDRGRLKAGAEPPAAPPAEFAFAFSSDGSTVQREGRAAVRALPRATEAVAVAPAHAVSWHRVTCPKAPAARLRAAVVSLLEDQLLDEPEAAHVALAGAPVAGQPVWVAVCDRAWLAAALQPLEAAGLEVDRVVPSAWPGEAAHGHVQHDGEDERPDAPVWLTWSDRDGVATWPLAGALARSLTPADLDGARLTASAAAATRAERWLGRPVTVVSAGEALLRATRSPCNLRQFDLAPRHRAVARLRNGWRRFLQPGWRPVRLGLVGLAAVQVIGLNAWAWQQRATLRQREAAKIDLVKQAFPQVQVVRPDAAVLQMQRELEVLRANAGVAGPQDLEVLLQTAASAWPASATLRSMRYEGGRLQLDAGGLGDDQFAALRDGLRPSGWIVEGTSASFSLRAAPPTTTP